MRSTLHPDTCTRQGPCHRSGRFHFSGHDMGSNSTMMKLTPLRPYADHPLVPTAFHDQDSNYKNGIYCAYSNPCYNLGRQNLNHFCELIDADRSFNQFSHGMRHMARGQKAFNLFIVDMLRVSCPSIRKLINLI